MTTNYNSAREQREHHPDSVPRVIIVAIVLGSILFVIIKLMIITCCIKQRKENRRREEKKLGERELADWAQYLLMRFNEIIQLQLEEQKDDSCLSEIKTIINDWTRPDLLDRKLSFSKSFLKHSNKNKLLTKHKSNSFPISNL